MSQPDNVFDRVAQQLIADRDSAYAGNPVSTRYFYLDDSSEADEIGPHYPQAKEHTELASIHQLRFRELLATPVTMGRITLHRSSKLTDNISSAAFSAYAYILSQRALDVFTQYDLGSHNIYPLVVSHRGTDYSYAILHFTNDMQE